MKTGFFILLLFLPFWGDTQSSFSYVEEIKLEGIPVQEVQRLWLRLVDDALGQPVCVPVLIAKGAKEGPVLGLTAAIHGDELNGIRIIQEVFDSLDLTNLQGTLIGIPGLNAVSIPLNRRRFTDEEDLNRNFPGKANGNDSQQYVWQITSKVIPLFDYLIDMHTASFGRVNSLYVRADLDDPQIRELAFWQDADIVLNNKGIPSAQEQLAATRTMRAEAVLKGIPAITVEYGNPQVYQPEMIRRGVRGLMNTLRGLQMQPGNPQTFSSPAICRKSYWIYVEKGGYLEVQVALNQKVKKGELLAILRDSFGTILERYFCPEDGIVIGKSTNPVNRNGGRIIHLGILDNFYKRNQ